MRKTVYKILRDFEKNNTYLNLKIKDLGGSSEDVAQIAVRVYGIVGNDELLNYLVDELTDRKKIDKSVRLILKMQIFEYRFLNKEEYVCVSEGVKLAKVYCKSASGFVNSNLRKLASIKDRMPSFANAEKNMSIMYSHPRFIVKQLMKDYDDYEQILKSNIQVKDTYVRKVGKLADEDSFEIVAPFNDLLRYKKNAIVRCEDFKQRNVIIQDLGSYLVGKLVAANDSDTILDLCAAPGNKTMHIAANAKHVVANELHEHRVKLIESNIQKYKIDNVSVICSDASVKNVIEEQLESKQLPLLYDKVLVDSPCSGWGVIKSKPEIKYNHTKQDIDAIREVSRSIVQNALSFLKPDGQLIFSTCTLNRNENDRLIKEICDENNLREEKDEEIEMFTNNTSELGVCLKNYVHNSDSFYMIKLERND